MVKNDVKQCINIKDEFHFSEVQASLTLQVARCFHTSMNLRENEIYFLNGLLVLKCSLCLFINYRQQGAVLPKVLLCRSLIHS